MPPPVEPTPEELEAARTLLRSLRSPELNGERDAERERRRPRFDGTINLGHILTIVTMGCALATMWVKSEVSRADHELRIRSLEAANAEFKNTLAKVADNQTVALRNQDSLRMTLEWIVKERDRTPK